MATRYRIILTTADLADALAHSAEGHLVSTTTHPEGVMALIEVEPGDAATYLESLLDEDDRVLSYQVQ